MDEPRGRRMTLPPVPPGGHEARLAVVERDLHHLAEDIGEVVSKIGRLMAGLGDIEKQVALLLDRAAEMRSSRDRWKTALLGFSSAIAVLVIGALIKISWNVQSARLSP